MKTVCLKINKIVPGYVIGATVNIETDEKEVPLNKFWRDRLHDAKTDGCVEIVKSKTSAKKETAEEITK